MEIINKQIFKIKDIRVERTHYFDEEQIANLGSRLDFATKKIEYFIEIEGYYPYIISKKDFEQLKKYMKEERDIVWDDDNVLDKKAIHH